MNKLKLYIGIIFITLSSHAFGQNATYGQIEERFTKEVLSKEDSMAFELAALQKVKNLIDLTCLYHDTSSSYLNKQYIKRRVSDLFFKDSVAFRIEAIDIDSLLINLKFVCVDSFNLSSIHWKSPGHIFGEISIGENDYFQVNAILLKHGKSFGNRKKEVWQVFLSKPAFK